MADQPRNPRRRQPDAESPRPVTPPLPPVPANPNDLEDLQLAPGDPYIQAAYNRVGKSTAQLSGSLGAAVREVDGTDALMIQKMARRSRVMSFQVQGIVWKAGFCKELNQSPPGSALRMNQLPPTEVQHQGVILRPVDGTLEMVFRELIPGVLMDAADRMYGLTRVISEVFLYFVPRDDGAITGIIAHYGDGPTSRSHYMYLQTSIRRADPAVLEQIHQTFQLALPKAQEEAKEHGQTDFWHELERSLYQVRATYRTSALHEGSEKVKSQLTTGLQKTGAGVDKAIGAVDKAGERLEWLVNMPVRGLIRLMQGMTNGLVSLIRLSDRLLRRK
ncbi:MAG TPA: hypothetical protein V6D05_10455 [Stenomitos sp.]